MAKAAAARAAAAEPLGTFLESCGLRRFEASLVAFGCETAEDLCDATLVTDALLLTELSPNPMTPPDIAALRRAADKRRCRAAAAAEAAAIAGSFKPVSGHWREVGFSDVDPALEFRSCGLLGCLALAHAAKRCRSAAALLQAQTGLPLAAGSVHVALAVAQLLGLTDGDLDGDLYGDLDGDLEVLAASDAADRVAAVAAAAARPSGGTEWVAAWSGRGAASSSSLSSSSPGPGPRSLPTQPHGSERRIAELRAKRQQWAMLQLPAITQRRHRPAASAASALPRRTPPPPPPPPVLGPLPMQSSGFAGVYWDEAHAAPSRLGCNVGSFAASDAATRHFDNAAKRLGLPLNFHAASDARGDATRAVVVIGAASSAAGGDLRPGGVQRPGATQLSEERARGVLSSEGASEKGGAPATGAGVASELTATTNRASPPPTLATTTSSPTTTTTPPGNKKQVRKRVTFDAAASQGGSGGTGKVALAVLAEREKAKWARCRSCGAKVERTLEAIESHDETCDPAAAAANAAAAAATAASASPGEPAMTRSCGSSLAEVSLGVAVSPPLRSDIGRSGIDDGRVGRGRRDRSPPPPAAVVMIPPPVWVDVADLFGDEDIGGGGGGGGGPASSVGGFFGVHGVGLHLLGRAAAEAGCGIMDFRAALGAAEATLALLLALPTADNGSGATSSAGNGSGGGGGGGSGGGRGGGGSGASPPPEFPLFGRPPRSVAELWDRARLLPARRGGTVTNVVIEHGRDDDHGLRTASSGGGCSSRDSSSPDSISGSTSGVRALSRTSRTGSDGLSASLPLLPSGGSTKLVPTTKGWQRGVYGGPSSGAVSPPNAAAWALLHCGVLRFFDGKAAAAAVCVETRAEATAQAERASPSVSSSSSSSSSSSLSSSAAVLSNGGLSGRNGRVGASCAECFLGTAGLGACIGAFALSPSCRITSTSFEPPPLSLADTALAASFSLKAPQPRHRVQARAPNSHTKRHHPSHLHAHRAKHHIYTHTPCETSHLHAHTVRNRNCLVILRANFASHSSRTCLFLFCFQVSDRAAGRGSDRGGRPTRVLAFDCPSVGSQEKWVVALTEHVALLHLAAELDGAHDDAAATDDDEKEEKAEDDDDGRGRKEGRPVRETGSRPSNRPPSYFQVTGRLAIDSAALAAV